MPRWALPASVPCSGHGFQPPSPYWLTTAPAGAPPPGMWCHLAAWHPVLSKGPSCAIRHRELCLASSLSLGELPQPPLAEPKIPKGIAASILVRQQPVGGEPLLLCDGQHVLWSCRRILSNSTA